MQLSAGIGPVVARRSHAVALLLLVACSHSDALSYRQPLNEGPLSGTNPTRLTYSPEQDLYAAWLPDGSGLTYTYVPSENSQKDRCLGILAPTGGQIQQSRCYRGDSGDDSTDVYEHPAPRADGTIAWLQQHTLFGRRVADFGYIVEGNLAENVPPRAIKAVPYDASTGSIHATITDLRWLSATQLAYLGNDVFVYSPCIGCKVDTLLAAREVMLLNTTGGEPVPLPNSLGMTSIWPTADSTGLYYTLGGDSRIYRRALAGGAPEVIHDFGAEGIARDVSVVGNTLAAVVGGNVNYGDDMVFGLRQVDSGGTIFTVDLGTGEETELVSLLCWRRPVVSPDGTRLAAEAYAATSKTNMEIWLYQIP